MSLEIQQDRWVDGRDICRSPSQPPASVDGTGTVGCRGKLCDYMDDIGYFSLGDSGSCSLNDLSKLSKYRREYSAQFHTKHFVQRDMLSLRVSDQILTFYQLEAANVCIE